MLVKVTPCEAKAIDELIDEAALALSRVLQNHQLFCGHFATVNKLLFDAYKEGLISVDISLKNKIFWISQDKPKTWLYSFLEEDVALIRMGVSYFKLECEKDLQELLKLKNLLAVQGELYLNKEDAALLEKAKNYREWKDAKCVWETFNQRLLRTKK